MPTTFRGMIPPVVTPMRPDGSVDLESLDRLVDHLVVGGMNGLFVLGSSGQVAYLTDEERDLVTARVVARTAGRIPVVCGTPDMSARRVIEQGRRAAALGVDAIVVTAPVYSLNDSAEIADHFRMVAEAVDVPVIAYDVPVRVRSKLGLDAQHHNRVDGCGSREGRDALHPEPRPAQWPGRSAVLRRRGPADRQPGLHALPHQLLDGSEPQAGA